MARVCPRCNRPNADDALQCLYCGESLPRESITKPATEKVAAISPPESYLVVISPVDEIRREWVGPMARLTGWDSYLVRQRLKSESPWILRIFQDLGKAQGLVQGLMNIGLDTYLLKKSGLLKLQEKLTPTGMWLAEDNMGFLFEASETGETGEKISFRYEDLFLLVRARVKQEREEEGVEGESGRVSLGSLFITEEGSEDGVASDDPLERLKVRLGRIKIKRRVSLKGASSVLSEVQMMDLYFQGSHLGIRVIENEFDFSGLGDKRTDSSMLNFNIFLRHLLDRCPQTIFDDGFKKISYSLSQGEETGTKRLDLLSTGEGGSAKKLYSCREFFNDYSSRIYLHHLRKAKKPPR